ncbi:MAG: cation:proton antiporter [Candidatus Sericytochromatia bacterium]|nr:cation:proton antiporter [Candidatus Sericytochromatia bacterium]
MPESPLLQQLALSLIAAAIGGVLAARLRLPLLVGYIAGGVLLGPGGFALIQDPDVIRSLADIGVVLLLFALGVEFRLDELRAFGRVALWGAALQIALTLAIVATIGLLAGQDWRWGVVWGCLTALSSTAVSMRLLSERGEVDSAHGRLTAGFLVVQDIAVVPMAIGLSWLAGGGAGPQFGMSWRQWGILLLVALILMSATRLLPKILRGVSAHHDREIYLLSVIGIGMLVAFGSAHLGLSLGLGAFVAGLVLSKSPYAQMALGGIHPLRDLFASLFFVSLGLLFRPAILTDFPLLVVLVLIAVVALKALTPLIALRLQGQSWRLSLWLSASLLPLGEFNLVLANQARQVGLIGQMGYDLLVLVTLWTATVAPLALSLAERVIVRRSLGQAAPSAETPSADILLVGLGRVGLTVAENLSRWGVAVTAIDLDEHAVIEARARGVNAIWGDATVARVLMAAGLPTAHLLMTTLPDATSNEIAIRLARRERPDIRVIARAHRSFQTVRLDRAGADVVIEPEFEGAITLLRAALEPLGRTHHRLGEEFARIRARYQARAVLQAGQPHLHIADCRLGADHPWIGQTLAAIQPCLPAPLLGIVRAGKPVFAPGPEFQLAEADELLLKADVQELSSICRLLACGDGGRL